MAGKHREKQPNRRGANPAKYAGVSAWLGAGAITLGVGAALATGAGVAHADDASGTDGSSASSNNADHGPASRAGDHTAATTESKKSTPAASGGTDEASSTTSKSRATDPPQTSTGSQSASRHSTKLGTSGPSSGGSTDTHAAASERPGSMASAHESPDASSGQSQPPDASTTSGDGSAQGTAVVLTNLVGTARPPLTHGADAARQPNETRHVPHPEEPTTETGANSRQTSEFASLDASPDGASPYPPIIPPGTLGTLADFPDRSWAALDGTDVQDSGFGDLTGSGTGHREGVVTRPLDDPDVGAVYVVEALYDYVQFDYFNHDDAYGFEHSPILSIKRINPGESLAVQERWIQVFAYTDGPNSPRDTIVDQKTAVWVVRLDKSIEEDENPPTAPTITTTDRTDTTVDLVVTGGTDDVGIVAYEIFRNGGLVRIVSVGEIYTDTLLNPATTYLYTARARDLAGNESVDSAPPLSVTTNVDPDAPPDETAPMAPTIAVTDRTSDTVDLIVSGGTDNVGVVAYKILRDGQFLTLLSPGEKFTDTGLNPTSTYVYTARTRDLAGNESSDSYPLTVTTLDPDVVGTPDVTPPTAPRITSTDWTSTTIDLVVSGGTDNVGVTAYEIFRDGQSVITVTAGATYTDIGLSPSTTYVYTARALDLAGNQSADSTPAIITTADVPIDPGPIDSTDGPLEQEWQRFLNAMNYIPLASNFISGLSIVVDLGQLIHAIAVGDRADIVDEALDLTDDFAGMLVPWPLSIAVNPLIDRVTDAIKEELIRILDERSNDPSRATRAYLAAGAPNECLFGEGNLVCLAV